MASVLRVVKSQFVRVQLGRVFLQKPCVRVEATLCPGQVALVAQNRRQLVLLIGQQQNARFQDLRVQLTGDRFVIVAEVDAGGAGQFVRRLCEHVVVGHLDGRDLRGGSDRSCGDFDFQHDVLILTAVKLADFGDDLLSVDLRFPAEDSHRTDVFLHVDLDGDFLSDDGQHCVELILENSGQVLGVLDENVVASAPAGKLQHQVLVVVQTEPHGGNGDAFFFERRSQGTKFGGRAGSDVGFSVGEQDDPVDSVFVSELAQLGSAFADSGEESCSAASLNLCDFLADRRFVGQLRRRDEHLDGRVVRHHGNDVVGTETVDRLDGSSAGLVNFRALHRSGLVEDQRDVDRSTRLRGLDLEAGQADLQKRCLFFLGLE